jgi:uncharacterized delta-60 repeat protein
MLRAAMLIALVLAAPASAASGDLDENFGEGGWLVQDAPPLPYDFAYQPGGGLILAGDDGNCCGDTQVLARLGSEGDRDSSFGQNGLVETGLAARPFVKVAPDGRLIVAGHTADGPVIERHLRDGALDATFGVNGRRRVPTRGVGDGAIRDLELARDGRVLAAISGSGPAGGDRGVAVVRLTADGSVDASFGDRGVTTLGPFPHLAGLEALALRPGGGVVGAGWITEQPRPYSGEERVERPLLFALRRDGSLARRNGRRGRTNLRHPDDEGRLLDIVSVPGGRAVALHAAVVYSGHALVVRGFGPGGKVDRHFGHRGRAQVSLPPALRGSWLLHPEELLRQADGKFLAAGYADICEHRGPCQSVVAVGRFGPGGPPDRQFGDDGLALGSAPQGAKSIYGFNDSYLTVTGVVVDPLERPVVGASILVSKAGLVRFQDSVAPRGGRLPARLPIDGNDRIRMTFVCREAGPACAGQLVVTYATQGRRRVRIVDHAFRATPGEGITVEAPLNARGQHLVERRGQLPVRALLRLRDANGNSVTRQRRVVLAHR